MPSQPTPRLSTLFVRALRTAPVPMCHLCALAGIPPPHLSGYLSGSRRVPRTPWSVARRRLVHLAALVRVAARDAFVERRAAELKEVATR